MTGSEFKRIREAMHLSQSGLARLLGLQPKTIGDLENGRMVISKSVENHIVAQYKLWQVRIILDSC